jgi:predicted Fe-Mo cluster-binding NifX family protein
MLGVEAVITEKVTKNKMSPPLLYQAGIELYLRTTAVKMSVAEALHAAAAGGDDEEIRPCSQQGART